MPRERRATFRSDAAEWRATFRRGVTRRRDERRSRRTWSLDAAERRAMLVALHGVVTRRSDDDAGRATELCLAAECRAIYWFLLFVAS